MNILYTLNDNFVPQVCAAICSICENNRKEKDIHFYLFSMNISTKNKKKITKFVSSYRRKIDIE